MWKHVRIKLIDVANRERNTMTNSYYNLLEVWGNDQVTKQVSEWNTALDTVDVPSDDVHRMGAIRKVFHHFKCNFKNFAILMRNPLLLSS